MPEVTMIGLDLAKNVFQIRAADAFGAVVLRRKVRRAQLLLFLSKLPRGTVAMEACSGVHFWGRQIARLGHEVRLIAPAYVKIP